MQRSHIYTREETEHLILLYQRHPCLYEVRSKLYKNKTKRLWALREITEQFNKLFPMANLTVEEVRKKINSVRTQFFHEENKVRKSIASGAGIHEVYTPTLWCYEMLGFLKNGEMTEASMSSLPVEELKNGNQEEDLKALFEGSVEELNETFEPRPNVSGATSRRRLMCNAPAQKAATLIDRAIKLLETSNENAPMDEIDAFGLSVVAELRNIKNKRRCFQLRKQIMDLIYEARDEEGF
ncbi:unnamed protein product [Callosobruchus maculatus]|uniref:MADF domain-containing protein n=1 Tax=Callosobruchus maculatus TaxID=64391 RepID=A0A653CJZ0_CALMS|nr:unnamed protein product [Callosobruchus maculatus]